MLHPLLEIRTIDQPAETYLRAHSTIFAIFGENSQDSGNISYGVQVGEARFFVKSAGKPDDPKPYLNHAQRVELLRNAVVLAAECSHPLLPRLHHVIESPQGPLLIYSWAEGELLGVPRAQRDDPTSSYQRFRRLPSEEILHALDQIYELHDLLARLGWIAVDFYDACLIYDFSERRLHVVDLDMYHRGPFTNTMGRMFGSSRFMAPEEFELGAPIDERTNVFTMGRTALLFLGDGTLTQSAFRGPDALYAVVHRACQSDRAARFESMAEFYTAWQTARH